MEGDVEVQVVVDDEAQGVNGLHAMKAYGKGEQGRVQPCSCG